MGYCAGDYASRCFTYYNGLPDMDLTRTESNVIQRLRRKRIATMKTLRRELDVSHMTVVRALNKYGYHSGLNHNASYYTLLDTPRFDAEGLWAYRDICFSEQGTLAKTLVVLTENAPAGMTVAEIEQRVNTKVGNLLSRLCRQNQLSRCFAGRQAVYLAVDAKRQKQQQQRRERQRQETQVTQASAMTERTAFPPHDDVVTVLEVLIQIIKSPKSDAAQLAKALRTRGVKITSTQVQRILDFYGFKKKRNYRGR
jgi:hypothetical protein